MIEIQSSARTPTGAKQQEKGVQRGTLINRIRDEIMVKGSERK
jgi:hypothetical protein